MAEDLFGHTAPAREEPRVYSVTEITRSVRTAIEEKIGLVWVEGEISNLRKQASGHQYFTLKDANSQLPCVLFARPGMWRKQVPLADGMQVQVRGTMTVYEARGQYQLNVQLVQAAGAGLLQAKFEALKRKLEAEGLFDVARKRPLPRFPAAIAIITSPTGAALRDMLNILGRRAGWIRVIICPVRVQGEGAAEEIAAAIEEVNRFVPCGLPPVDVVVVARGGGSVEDLWEFNEEIVARAIAASALPVVSAVGHEIDFTIADFAADLRAPTPSAAAELLVPDRAELLRRCGEVTAQLRRHAARAVEQQRARLAWLVRSELFRQPVARLREAAQRLDLANEDLERARRERLGDARQRLTEAVSRLRQHRPDHLLALWREQLRNSKLRLAERFAQQFAERKQRLRKATDGLRMLGPRETLARGYSLTLTADGKLIRSIGAVRTGMKVVTRLSDGEFTSKAE
ncbi:MAG: exodeoxyribonuclease large subunit [Chthoniobacter sp.]|jgi:exodeoxyribonuclease VII large subunit|nr:exodeoxyribonuclease large subunit [Chthoniobacter sp.]